MKLNEYGEPKPVPPRERERERVQVACKASKFLSKQARRKAKVAFAHNRERAKRAAREGGEA